MRFGAHLPTGGNPAAAPERAGAIGCQTLQLFCGNPRGWPRAGWAPDRARRFREAAQRAGLEPVIVHATYLINLAAPEERVYARSVESFLMELRRAAALGAAGYVVHSGSHKGTGAAAGRTRVRAALHRALSEIPETPVILLENTAGAGHSLGARFEDFGEILAGLPEERTGVCLDTCHAWAAGYDIRTPEGTVRVLDEFQRRVGLARLRLLHLNDAKGPLGSHLDRHEHIGRGALGDEGFRAFLSDVRLHHLPAILETPLKRPEHDWQNLRRVVRLAVQAGAAGPEALARIPARPPERRRKSVNSPRPK